MRPFQAGDRVVRIGPHISRGEDFTSFTFLPLGSTAVIEKIWLYNGVEHADVRIVPDRLLGIVTSSLRHEQHHIQGW